MKLFFRTFLILLTTLSSASFSQNEEEIKKQLARSKHDTTSARLLYQLALLGSARGDTTYQAELMVFCKKRYKDPAIDDSTHKVLTMGLIQSLNGLGFLKQQAGERKRAVALWTELLELDDKYMQKSVIPYALLNIGYVNDHSGNLPVALDLYHKALTGFEEEKDTNGLGAVMNNMASLYNRQGEKTKAMEYYEKGLAVQKNSKNKMGSAYILDNLAGLYLEKKDTVKARELWERSIKIHTELKNKVGIATVLQRFADLERLHKNYSAAIEMQNKALSLHTDVNNRMGIGRSYISLCKIYGEMNELQKAKTAGEKAFELLSTLKYPKEMETISYVLSQIYVKLGDFKNAFKMQVLFKQMADTVSNENSRKTSIRKNFEYAFQKQAAQDSVKTAEAQKVFNAEIKHQKTQSMALYIGLGLVAIFSIFMYNRFRITQKQKKIIEHQKHLVDEKQKEIIQSIQYAKRIQQALMPSEKIIQKNLDELM
jgi:tetratricopeptide (TPR) repeat protein